MSGWTRTGDEYPLDQQAVLGWVINIDGGGYVDAVVWTSAGDWVDGDETPILVSHWMPLPEGPQ